MFKEGKLDKSGCLSPVKKRYLKKVKKNIRNPQNWEKNKRKAARNSGKEYDYFSKRHKEMRTKKAAEIGPPCTCKKKCTDTLNSKNPEIIPTIFKHYWEIRYYDMQTADSIAKTNRKPSAKEIELGPDNPSRNKGRTTYCVTYEGETWCLQKSIYKYAWCW